jgi:ribosomal protein L11 methyltransferase
MSNIYIGYHFKVEPKEVGSEILIAELGETAFEFYRNGNWSFCCTKELWDGTILENIRILKSAEFKIEYTYEEMIP